MDRAQKSVVRSYFYNRSGISEASVKKARQYIEDRAKLVCTAAGARGAVKSQESLTILPQEVTQAEIDSGAVRLFLDDHFVTSEEFANFGNHPIYVFAALHCDSKALPNQPNLFFTAPGGRGLII